VWSYRAVACSMRTSLTALISLTQMICSISSDDQKDPYTRLAQVFRGTSTTELKPVRPEASVYMAHVGRESQMSGPFPGCFLLQVDHHCRSRRAALLRVDEGNHSSCASKMERSRRCACGTVG